MARPKPEPVLSITRFFTGLVTQRNPLNTPFSFMGLNLVQRHDALIGGTNCELSNNFTLQRRPGFPRYCPSGFASNEFPLAFKSFRINGAIVDVVDTNLAVYTFNASGKTLLFTKSAGAGQTFFQQIGNIVYFANGVDNKKWVPPVLTWAANTAFTLGQFITDSNGNVQQVTTAGTSGPGPGQPVWSTSVRGTTTDNGITWTMRGTPVQNWGVAAPTSAPGVTNSTAGATGTSFWTPNTVFHGAVRILDTNGNVQDSLGGGTSGATFPLWGPGVGAKTTDGNIPWFNSGPVGTWTPSTVFNPGIANPIILDSNGNWQQVSVFGTTGTTLPAWATTIGATTTDGTVTWRVVGPAQTLAFSGYQWCFAYHTVYGHVSTASPLSVVTGPMVGTSFSVPLSGTGSPDPQCDYIWVFRIADGGFAFQFMGQVANPGNTTWNLTDTVVDANLSNQILAPLAHSNDPPPAGMTYLTYYMKRMWGAAGNTMVYGLGPDRITGVAEESWPPANLETYASPVQAMKGTSQGLVVMTYDEWWVELGGPQGNSFYPQKILENFGISSPNCLAADGDQLYVYTSARQFFTLSLASGKNEDGFNIGDIFTGTNASFPTLSLNPATSYVTIHRNGPDNGVFLSDGSTTLLRYSLTTNTWSNPYPIVGGVGAINSVETAFGTWALMAGRAAGNGFIIARSLTSFFDDVIANVYTWSAQIGSLIVSTPGTPTEEIRSIVVQSTKVGSAPAVGVLANEISGGFVNVPFTCNDPHDTSGTPYDPQTMRAQRFDWEGIQQQLPNSLRHMQVQISWPAENFKNELLGVHLCPQIEG